MTKKSTSSRRTTQIPKKPSISAKKTTLKTAVSKKTVSKKSVSKHLKTNPTRKPTTKKTVTKASVTKKAPAKNQRVARSKSQKKQPKQLSVNQAKRQFKIQDFVVYPGYGVGRVLSVDTLEVGGQKAEVFVLEFPTAMLVRVPVDNVNAVGMRKLADTSTQDAAMRTLCGRARIKRTMWSRRAQEYEAKINSGNLVAIAEVVRDLYRNAEQPEQSYSERQLYEQALERMVQEIAILRNKNEADITNSLEDVLCRATGGTAPASRARNAAMSTAAE